MFILLNDQWALSADEHCWIIKKYQESNEAYPDGRWISKYFCTEFKNVVKRLAKVNIRLNNATTMDELVKHAESVHSDLSLLLDYEVADA